MPLAGTFGSSSTRGFGGLRSFRAATVSVEYLVIAGGGGGGGVNLDVPRSGGGGGAGGYRNSVSGELTGGGGSAESALSLAPGTYTVTVGGGGSAGGTYSPGGNGQNSVFGSITSSGGGGGGAVNQTTGSTGGSAEVEVLHRAVAVVGLHLQFKEMLVEQDNMKTAVVAVAAQALLEALVVAVMVVHLQSRALQ